MDFDHSGKPSKTKPGVYSGARFKKKQAFDVIQALNSEEGRSKIPDLPILIALESKDEIKFVADIKHRLQNRDHYAAIPMQQRTVELRCLIFRMGSCAGCLTVDRKRCSCNVA